MFFDFSPAEFLWNFNCSTTVSEGFGSFVRESSSQSTATPSPPLPLRLKGNFGIENLCLWMGFSVSVSPVHVGIVPAVRFTRSSTAVETITFFE